ncbi:bestrophin family protein [Nostoc sp.]|uniref:bestrophin family protein n=1 Tax=Nostoc sp. TaxID=1180 RepID=UPI003593CDF3
MTPPSYPKKQKSQMIASSKKSNYLRSWKQKYHDYSGKRLNWFQVILLLQGSIIVNIIPWIGFFSVYSLIISLLEYHEKHIPLPRISNGLPNIVLSFNLVLSLLLIFRTNAANERHWEGRKLWGVLVNTSRNLGRGISIIIEERSVKDRLEKEKIIRLVTAFALAMKLHLRREPVNAELIELMSSLHYSQLKNTNHPPLQIAFWIETYLQDVYHRNLVDVYQLNRLQNLVDDLVDILGGCERILKTPIPLVYSIFLKQLLIIYCLILPIELVSIFKWWTIPVMIVISLILFGIEEIGSELENPFGHDPNDLPLDMICDTISGNIEDLITSASQSYEEV